MMTILALYLAVIPALAVCFGVFGSFSMWGKTAFFGHVFSHSLLLPLSIGLLIGGRTNGAIMMTLVIVFSVLFVVILRKIDNGISLYYGTDVILTIVSFFCMAMALFVNNINPQKTDVMLYMSGDILFIRPLEIVALYVLTFVLLLFLLVFYKALILRLIGPELAVSPETRHGETANVLFLIMQSIFIAISCRSIGILLISATMIMPAALARLVADGPKQMILLSILFGLAVMTVASVISAVFDLWFAPIVIMLYCVCFGGMFAFKFALNR